MGFHKKLNAQASGKKDLGKDREIEEKKETERVLSLSVGEAWLSNTLIAALVCSLPQTASSCRAELCWPVGARDYTDYSPGSNITNNHYSQETAATVESTEGWNKVERYCVYVPVILSMFDCLCRRTVHLVFLSFSQTMNQPWSNWSLNKDQSRPNVSHLQSIRGEL